MNKVTKAFFDTANRSRDLSTIENIQNSLQPQQFKLTMDKVLYPAVEFTIQNFALPGVTAPSTTLTAPQIEVPLPGDSIEFEPIEIQFLVDEGLLNYEEILLWLVGNIQVADNEKEYKKTRDISLQILSSHNNLVREIDFYDAFPTSLSGLSFDITTSDTQYMIANVTFEYSYFVLGDLVQQT